MSCPNVFNAFAVATESLAQDVYKRASYRSMWLNMIERGEYPQGTGLTQTSFTTTSIAIIGRASAQVMAGRRLIGASVWSDMGPLIGAVIDARCGDR
jgi:hypothetical protein